MSEDDYQWMQDFIENRRWQTGKADPSHQYTIEEWEPALTVSFRKAVSLINQHGEDRPFYTRTYRYWVVDGMRYWNIENVLNRAVEG